ncbi:transcription factor iws1 [Pyrrhoderma noxium]|uniref:Transcription factor iws1 n=1 Tax=Pyrrhoderma noxium TaxID=2282107 RepID=A0A286U9D2_9AGAM|nr:transcription factor iws1 [Pyrrhoderma noxium]
MSNRLERDIFGGSDSELSSEEDFEDERHERRRISPAPDSTLKAGADESSGESGDEYVQEEEQVKRLKKKKIKVRDEAGKSRKKRKRRERQESKEDEEAGLTAEQLRRLQIDRQIDAIVKQKKNPRQKKRKNNADEDVLDRFADEEVTQLREEMLRAAADDDEANRDKMPGVAKLKLLPRVKDVLQKSSLAQSIMDNNLLEGVRRWLEPLPDRSLPALNIQYFLFEQLNKMYIDTNSLKESGLGRVILFYTKCKRVQPQIARIANDLVSLWSRPIIKRSASYRDRHIPLAPGPGSTEDGIGMTQQKAPERLNAILARARKKIRIE